MWADNLEIEHLQRILTAYHVQHWIHHEVFTPQWFLGMFMMTVPWIIWTRLIDKTRLIEIFGLSCTAICLVTLLDGIGLEFGLWNYPFHVTPFSRLLCVDVSVLPVAFGLLYQYFSTWVPFVISNILFGAFAAFAAEPFFVWIHMYHLIHWRYIYSFPIYIAIGIFLKSLYAGLSRSTQRANMTQHVR